MINRKKVVVVLPAFNAARTLEKTVREIPAEIVDAILLVDDASTDNTLPAAIQMGIPAFVHNANHDRNQKTCYNEALKRRWYIDSRRISNKSVSPAATTPQMGPGTVFCNFRRQMGLKRRHVFLAP